MTPAGPDTMERPVCACWLIAENGAISKHCLFCLRPVSYVAQLLWPKAFVRGGDRVPHSCTFLLLLIIFGKLWMCDWERSVLLLDSCNTHLQLWWSTLCLFSMESDAQTHQDRHVIFGWHSYSLSSHKVSLKETITVLHWYGNIKTELLTKI